MVYAGLAHPILHPDFQSVGALENFCAKLPAYDNHTHGGSSAPPEVAAEIALAASKRAGEKLICHETGQVYDSAHQLADLYREVPWEPSLKEYLRRYHIVRNWLATTPEDIERVAYESAMVNVHKGSVGMDIRTSIRSGPLGDTYGRSVMGHVDFGPFQEFDAWTRGLERAATEARTRYRRPFSYGLTICLRRDQVKPHEVERNIEIVRLAAQIREHLIQSTGHDSLRAIDFAGLEPGNKLKHHSKVCEEARKLGFKITAHGGESWDEGGIRQAVNNLGVDRIGHATSLYPFTTVEIPSELRIYKNHRDKSAVMRLLARGIPTEMCLTSNLWTRAIITRGYEKNNDQVLAVTDRMTDVAQYPHERFLALGGMNLVCTDGNYTLGGLDLAGEYALGAQAFGWGIKEMLVLALQSITQSFLHEEEKNQLIQGAFIPVAQQHFATRSLRGTLVAVYGHERQWRQELRDKHGVSDHALGFVNLAIEREPVFAGTEPPHLANPGRRVASK